MISDFEILQTMVCNLLCNKIDIALIFARKVKQLEAKQYDKIVLGIDPGTNITGYGLVGIKSKTLSMVSMGIIDLSKFEDHAQKLHRIFERVSSLIRQYSPDEIAIEAPFYGKNVQSMLKLGRAQGVAIAAALQFGLPIFEYSPKKIKLTITGSGNASKEQIADMVARLLKFENDSHFLDTTDALGAAICHVFQFAPTKFGAIGNKKVAKAAKADWGKFLKDNPDKLR
jgi:crossover junction endodeoxyribonuclease RuvC